MSISVMKSQKQRFVNFFYKMETQKATAKENMHMLVDKFDALADKNDLHVKKDIDGQRDRLRRRLDKRKTESFMSHTMNANSFQFGAARSLSTFDEGQERKENQEMFDNFLAGLEEQYKGTLGDLGESEKSELKSTSDEKTFSDSNLSNFKAEKSPKHWDFSNKKKFRVEEEIHEISTEEQEEKDKENIISG